ncbi:MULTISPECIES: phosphoglycerate kinase [Dietzia]|uniref:Phosphoglycerate kinase n=1 Tax=Dietzia maris TaxID=37915 RepID=A0AAE4QT88_9ACTN|nr:MULTISPECIES: phosphoglycerate kinase [Dietzia]MCY1656979.1 phosphoglycerate kinase [Dietzia sp. SL131]MDV6297676.1 phosphoglycerate kinase [Dietzia maris]
MAVSTLNDLLDAGVEGRKILVRCDLNVPLDGSTITDAGRITASLPTLNALLDAGAALVITAHLGRPKGEPDPEFSLAPVAEKLGDELGRYVQLAGDVVGSDARERANGLTDGDVLLVENVRFDPRETSKDEAQRAEFAAELASLVGEDGAFVSNGFGVVHRAQASVYDVAKVLPAYAGDLVQSEVEVLANLSGDPEHPYAVVLGGSKVSDKLAVIEALAPKVDTLVIGGGMCFTFLAAQGHEVGSSLLQEEMIDTCKDLLAKFGDVISLPVDVVAADGFAADAAHSTVSAEAIPEGKMGLDIGPESVKAFSEKLSAAKTVFWNGPMGVFEFAAFSAGTRGVAEAIITATKNGAFSVVGGGDSAAAVRTLGLGEENFSHISTGGGASLEYLEGKELPGVTALERSN